MCGAKENTKKNNIQSNKKTTQQNKSQRLFNKSILLSFVSVNDFKSLIYSINGTKNAPANLYQ